MKFIAHRGIYNGKDAKYLFPENSPNLIRHCIEHLDLDVEIDIYRIKDRLFLGHDSPDFLVDENFLYRYRHYLWIHCKDFESFSYLMDRHELQLNLFMHNRDILALTSHGFFWHLGADSLNFNRRSILVLPEQHDKSKYVLEHCKLYGICSDDIIKYREKYKNRDLL